jgi:hypothetical protein
MWLLSMSCLLLIGGCRHAPAPNTVEVPVTIRGCSDALIQEHADLFNENIRLRAALKLCQEKK